MPENIWLETGYPKWNEKHEATLSYKELPLCAEGTYFFNLYHPI